MGHTSVEVGTLHLLTHVLAGCRGYGTVSVEIYDGKVHGGSCDASWTVNKVYSCSEADVVCISLVRLYIILTIHHIGLLRVYCETCALFLITKIIIFDKEVSTCEKLNISYKSMKDSNTFVFDPVRSRICRS